MYITTDDDIIYIISSFFHADVWYDDIKEFTINSFLIKLYDADVKHILTKYKLPETLLNYIKDKISKPIFLRLNSLSSKYKNIISLEDAIYHIGTTDRTVVDLKKKERALFVC
jgi:hypothetical protein